MEIIAQITSSKNNKPIKPHMILYYQFLWTLMEKFSIIM